MTVPTDEQRDAAVSERLRSLAARTRDVQASRNLLLRLDAIAEGRPGHKGGLSLAIVRFAVPSLVSASLAAGVLLALDRTGDPTFDDELALAATMEVEP